MVVAKVGASRGYVRDCMDTGFDPWQLACSTCNILPKSVKEKCFSCCQSYKNLEKKARRFEAALLLDSGLTPAVDELLNEDYDNIMKQKRGLQVRKLQGGSMFQKEPSTILWFDKALDPRESSALETLASEVMVLDGLSRDDLRDMLLSLLPDAE